MDELEKNARELILAITEKILKTLKDKGLLKEPSKLQMLYHSSEMQSLLKKLNAPKYDPCRKFRKGDKVRVVEWNGRRPQCVALLGKETIVLRDESSLGVRIQIGESGESYCTPEPCFLELVTPVEELESYHLNEIYDIDDGKLIGYEVARVDTRDAIFYGGENHLRTIEQAKERAEAERDRLNAENRKEQL